AAWGRVLHDPDLAEAILDRVLERGRHIELRGRSYRTRHAPLDLNPAPEPPSPAPARVSGNHRPEFPEPTGSRGVLFFRSRRWQEKLRDTFGVVLVFFL